MPYSRTKRHQPRHDNGSSILDTKPSLFDSYGYLKETDEHPTRTGYTHNQLLIDARVFIKGEKTFESFRNYVSTFYVENEDFIWRTDGMKIRFEAHMEEIRRAWPKHLK